jgi:purine-binding chemotaxis protein CheW
LERQLVIFSLEKEHYGIHIADVESIIKMLPITRMPHSPQFVEGVINLRGAVLPVVDLRKRFGLSTSEPDRQTRIIVVTLSGLKVGIVVDSVAEVLTVSESDIETTPAMVTTADSTFLTGIAKINDQLIIMLDLKKVLTLSEQSSLSGLTTA